MLDVARATVRCGYRSVNPIGNDAWTNDAAPDHGYEVGDQCAYNYRAPLGTVTHHGITYFYNQVINGHDYFYQMM